MTDKYLKHNNLSLELAGVIACASTLAFVQWVLNKDSIEQPEIQTFIKYILIDLVCFFIAFLLVKSFGAIRLRRSLRCLIIALLGAVSSTLIIDLPFFYGDIQNWHGHILGWIQKALFIIFMNSIITLLVTRIQVVSATSGCLKNTSFGVL